jgi:hypothetical protein
MPNGDVLDSFLVGYYEGRKLMYAASVRAGIPTDYRRSFFRISKSCARHDAHSPTCQIGGEGRWGEVTAAKIAPCRWLEAPDRCWGRISGADAR